MEKDAEPLQPDLSPRQAHQRQSTTSTLVNDIDGGWDGASRRTIAASDTSAKRRTICLPAGGQDTGIPTCGR